MGAKRQALPDQGASPAVVYIAKCVEHGLHGERDDCFICEKPVDHVSYVRADEYANRLEDLRRIEAERDRLRAGGERLRASLQRIACQGGGRWSGERMATLGNTGEEWVHWEVLAQRALASDEEERR